MIIESVPMRCCHILILLISVSESTLAQKTVESASTVPTNTTTSPVTHGGTRAKDPQSPTASIANTAIPGKSSTNVTTSAVEKSAATSLPSSTVKVQTPAMIQSKVTVAVTPAPSTERKDTAKVMVTASNHLASGPNATYAAKTGGFTSTKASPEIGTTAKSFTNVGHTEDFTGSHRGPPEALKLASGTPSGGVKSGTGTGYSGGSMFGLAVGMLIVGGLVGILAGFVKWRSAWTQRRFRLQDEDEEDKYGINRMSTCSSGTSTPMP